MTGVEFAKQSRHDPFKLTVGARRMRQVFIARGQCVPVQTFHGWVVKNFANNSRGLFIAVIIPRAWIYQGVGFKVNGLAFATTHARSANFASVRQHNFVACQINVDDFASRRQFFLIASVPLHAEHARTTVIASKQNAFTAGRDDQARFFASNARQSTNAQIGVV